ncbi:hypothetical protein JCM5353_005546 [Sporobolomyces roseus]
MSTNDTQLFYGRLIDLTKLCIAAEAHSHIKSQLHFFKLLRLRLNKGSIAINEQAGAVNVSKIPQDIWGMIEKELILKGLGEAEMRLTKEATKLLREEFTWVEYFNETGYEWSDDMLSEAGYDWEKFVSENGGVSGPFKKTPGAVRILLDHVESVRELLKDFGLVLPTTQSFILKSLRVDTPFLPITLLSSSPVDTTSDASNAINIRESEGRVPFISRANPGCRFAIPVMLSDLRMPMKLDTSPRYLTSTQIDEAVLPSVPSKIENRFNHFDQFYCLARNKHATLGSEGKVLMFEL